MELSNQYYEKNSYFETTTGNKVSQRSKIPGNANIFPVGKVIIRSGCILRGDLAKICLGKCCVIEEEVILHPPYYQRKGQLKYKQMEIGSHVHIEKGCIISAEKIGSNVKIHKNSIISNRCQIQDNSMILEDSVLAPDTVVPSFSVYGGRPARFLGELTEAMPFIMKDFTLDFIRKFKPRVSSAHAPSSRNTMAAHPSTGSSTSASSARSSAKSVVVNPS